MLMRMHRRGNAEPIEFGTFDNLNSMNGKGNSTEGVNYLFDSLMDRSLDEPRVMYPYLLKGQL